MSAYNTLLSVGGGDTVTVRIEDFENTRFPKDENPREISAEVTHINEDVSYSAGEIQRTIAIGDPWNEGCYIDCGDTSENQLTGGHTSRKYLKAWRPRANKDRLLLGRVTGASSD